jgi:SAM-dependent methyltransferase
MGTRWEQSDRPRGDDYDARWQRLAAAGVGVHGEADLIDSLLRESGGNSVLDAGCGTGRVAIELAARGFSVVGLDADTHLDETFDLVALAGNVMIFVDRGTEAAVLDQVAARVKAGGLVVAGFQSNTGRLSIDRYDELAAAAGLQLVDRWATWDREPFSGGDYAVSLHRRT